jgi:hypothetical protein
VFAAIEGTLHDTVPRVPTGGVAHDQPEGVTIEPNVVFEGRASTMATLTAVLEPAGFVAVMVKVRSWPAVTGLGAALLLAPRFTF